MKLELAIFGFIVLDTLCGAWSVTYYGDRIVSFGGTPTIIGLMVACRALCTTFAAPILGRLSDKLGRRPVALIVVSGTLLTTVIEYFASNLWMYSMSRITFGLTRACITVANGMVCDLVTDSKDRPKAMGRNFSAVGIGFLIGSAVGGVVASSADAYHLASALNLFFAICSFAWTFLFLVESSKDVASSTSKPSSTNATEKKSSEPQASLISAVKTLLSNEDLRALFLFHALVLICNISPQHAYFEFLRTELALSTAMRGLFLVAIGLASAAAQSLFPLAVARLGTARFVLVSIVGTCITMFIAPLGGFILFATATLFGTLFSVVSSTSLSALSHNSPSHLSGTVSGLHESLTNLALVIGGLYVPVASQIHMFAPFWICSVLLALTLVLLRPKLLFEAEVPIKKKIE